MSKKLVETPVKDLVGNPNKHTGSDVSKYDGEPGLPARTSSKNAVPEVTYDGAGAKKKGK